MNDISENLDLNNKKILFLAETNFQFINCINIAYHTKNSICDLYINKLYSNADDYKSNIKETKLFRKIHTYDLNFGRIKKFFAFNFFQKYILKILEQFDYDYVFFASRDFFSRCVLTYCKYVYKSAKIISYDEGLGSYISRMEEYTNKIEKFIIKIRYHDKANIITDKILYKPEAYIGKANNITIYKMPKLEEPIVKLLNKIYNYDDSMKFNSNIIYFDNYYDGKDLYKKSIIDCLISETNGSILLKKHPQTSNGIYDYNNVYDFSQLPYEIIAANDNDIDKKVLITIMSSAVWTPMLIFNKYPKIVLMYQLFDNDVTNEAKQIIEKMVSMYPKERIEIIKSFDELHNL